MARVEIKGLAVGVVQNTRGDVVAGMTFICSGTVYTAATGGTTLTGSQLKTNNDGEMPGWLEPDVYTISVPITSKTVTFEVGGFSSEDELPALDARVDALEASDTTLDIRTDSLESSSAALLARNLSGTGSPEGAVTASPGATYQQTDGAENATHWLKETGTGNTGWRLARRRYPCVLELFGPEPRAANALLGDALVTSYDFPGDALSASLQHLVPEVAITAKLVKARWLLVWTPNATGCGVQLVHADVGPANITQVAEFTSNAATTPVASAVDITSTLATLIDAGARKFVGHRLKGNGAVGPVVFVSRVELLFEG